MVRYGQLALGLEIPIRPWNKMSLSYFPRDLDTFCIPRSKNFLKTEKSEHLVRNVGDAVA